MRGWWRTEFGRLWWWRLAVVDLVELRWCCGGNGLPSSRSAQLKAERLAVGDCVRLWFDLKYSELLEPRDCVKTVQVTQEAGARRLNFGENLLLFHGCDRIIPSCITDTPTRWESTGGCWCPVMCLISYSAFAQQRNRLMASMERMIIYSHPLHAHYWERVGNKSESVSWICLSNLWDL